MSLLVLFRLPQDGLARILAAVRGAPGLLSVAPAQEPGEWGLVMRWRDEAAFEAWRGRQAEPWEVRSFLEPSMTAEGPSRLETELIEQLNALLVDYRAQGRRLADLQAGLTACAGCGRVRVGQGDWTLPRPDRCPECGQP